MNRSIKILTSTIMFLSALSISNAQSRELPVLKEIKGKKLQEHITPAQNEKTKLWGFVNEEGKFVIRPVFDNVHPYEGNFARICFDGKWGVIDERAMYKMNPIMDRLDHFSPDSIAVARYGKRMGLVTPSGSVVLTFAYDSMGYTPYGYHIVKDSLVGTVDNKGNVLLEPQFDEVVMLDESRRVEHIRIKDKWGLLHDGVKVLGIKWDEKLTFLQSGKDGQPDLYLARRNGKTGIVTLYGKDVVPCIYDSIELASSGEYYITTRNGLYGAITLKMVDFIPPLLADKPYIGDGIFKIHDNGRFFCANVQGCIKFEDCADLYSVFRPEEYVSTKTLPSWAKTHEIEKNLSARQERLDRARALLEKGTASEGMEPVISGKIIEKYGLLENGLFRKSSGNVGKLNVIFSASSGDSDQVYLASSGSELFVSFDDVSVSLNAALTKFNVKKFDGIYPKGYTRLNEHEIVVLLAFVCPESMRSEPLVETNPYMLPVPSFKVNVHQGSSDQAEKLAAIRFSSDSLAAVSFHELKSGNYDCVRASRYGGFYLYRSSSAIAERNAPLVKYDIQGSLDWEYVPASGDVITDIEETENYVYLCGSTKEGSAEVPLLVKLTKRGVAASRKTLKQKDTRLSDILCANYLLYAKSVNIKNGSSSGNYRPMFNLEDMGDNVGVMPACAWNEWGTGVVGGLGLVDETGKWLQTPILTEDQMSTSFDWEFSGFTGDVLIVRHMGLYGLVNRSGEFVVDARYDQMERLANPSFFKAVRDGKHGVIDASGKTVLPFEYSYVGNMSEDIIVVAKDGKYGCFDKSGKMIIPMEFEEMTDFVNGLACIRYKKRYGFIDRNGEIIVAPFSDQVEYCSEGCILVNIKDRFGFVSDQGDWVVPPMYEAGTSFSNGLASLTLGGKTGFIDNTGKFVIPMLYNDVKAFDKTSGLACVAVDRKWGVIDKAGNQILQMKYDSVDITSDGYIYVELGGKAGIYSASGVEICPPEYDSIERNAGNAMFKYGVTDAVVNSQRVRIDEQGNVIYPYAMQQNL